MSEKDLSTGMSRRQLLRMLGVASVASTPLLPGISGRVLASTVGRIAARPLSIGVLLPQAAGASHPALEGFVAGMRLRFDALDHTSGVGAVSFRVENSGRGVTGAVAAAQRLVESRVDVVVGLMNPRAVHLVHGALDASNTTLVAASAGERMAPVFSPNVFHCSLQGWQSQLAAGTWSASNVGRRAVMISSFSESGYDLLPAFRRGFEAAGGEILDSHVVDAPLGGVSIRQALAAAAAAQPDVVYALFSGAEAERFLQLYAASPLAGRAVLVGSGLMVEEQRLAGKGMRNVVTVLPWSESLESSTNRTFVEGCRKQSGRRANLYSLLGYDTASFIAEGLAASGGDPRHARFRSGLRSASFDSPRGRLTVDRATQNLVSPLYLLRSEGALSSSSHRFLSELPRVADSASSSLTAAEGCTGGWLHSSLAI